MSSATRRWPKRARLRKSQLDTEIQAKLGAQALVLAAKANVEQAELNVEFTKVTSLVSGIAGIARVQIGNLVGPSSILTSVSQVDPIKAYFTVERAGVRGLPSPLSDRTERRGAAQADAAAADSRRWTGLRTHGEDFVCRS